MAVHRYHPADADPTDAILFDGCTRCSQHADYPFASLDDRKLMQLWDTMIEVEFSNDGRGYYATATEGRAAGKLYSFKVALDRMEKLGLLRQADGLDVYVLIENYGLIPDVTGIYFTRQQAEEAFNQRLKELEVDGHKMEHTEGSWFATDWNKIELRIDTA